MKTPFKRSGTAKPSFKPASLAERIDAILSSEKIGFGELVKAAGLDPARDFSGRILEGLPLREEDIAGFDFSGSNLRQTGIHLAKGIKQAKFQNAVFDADLPSLDPSVIAFNKRLKDVDHRTRRSLLDQALKSNSSGLDVVSLGTATSRARDLEEAQSYIQRFASIGVPPNVFVFSTLINKAATEEVARHWYQEMRNAKIEPNVTTFNTLINKAATEAVARHWYQEMIRKKITPDSFTHYHGKRFDDIALA